MDIPYGFDCYAFAENEVKYFERNITRFKHSVILDPHQKSPDSYPSRSSTPIEISQPSGGQSIKLSPFAKFTRRNEKYPMDQLQALGQAGRLNMSELNKRIFCGIKIQIGIGVITNFLRRGLQYRPFITGRSKLLENGSWTGVVKGLTVDKDDPISYEIAVGNFLGYDEEFPYLKFGPFYTVESKLVILTGRSHSVEASSFGTNINGAIWFTVLSFILTLSLLATFRIRWERSKQRHIEAATYRLASEYLLRQTQVAPEVPIQLDVSQPNAPARSPRRNSSVISMLEDRLDSTGLLTDNTIYMIQHFFFIYYTMLLARPSLEFDEFIWPKHPLDQTHRPSNFRLPLARRSTVSSISYTVDQQQKVALKERIKRHVRRKRHIPTSIRIVSYLWSAACFVMSSTYSGELLAVILLHADQNIDTISQLINAVPPIEPVIRKQDFTYDLMLKSLDSNMIKLYNMTKTIDRSEVYSRKFIEKVSQRKQALLGDDELIETIYDIYHKYYPLYKSKMTYLQYPISIMYRNDLNASLEADLRRGLVQIFEMGLIHRWYQAQKETYIQFYDTSEKKKASSNNNDMEPQTVQAEQKYKPLSIHHFASFFRLMIWTKVFALIVLLIEIAHSKITARLNRISINVK